MTPSRTASIRILAVIACSALCAAATLPKPAIDQTLTDTKTETAGDQKRVAEAYIQQLTTTRAFPKRIVTKVAPLHAFYRAEDYHQDYVPHCRQNLPVCANKRYVDHYYAPKLASFRQQFPQFVKGDN
jgi:hypothetical protein